MTVAEALHCQHQLTAISDTPLLDCQLLLEHCLHKNRAWLLAYPEAILTEPAQTAFLQLLERRRLGEPVSYLLGQQGFWDMSLVVSPATLIPRPETELLVELTLQHGPAADAPARCLDLGTGSGAVALAIARERPAWQVMASDASFAALHIAARNAAQWQPDVALLQGNWLDAIASHSLDIIVANPPYIDSADSHLPALVHEPASALVADNHGLADLDNILANARRCLAPNGLLLMEHGHDQQRALLKQLTHSGYEQVTGMGDLNHQPRVVMARQPE